MSRKQILLIIDQNSSGHFVNGSGHSIGQDNQQHFDTLERSCKHHHPPLRSSPLVNHSPNANPSHRSPHVQKTCLRVKNFISLGQSTPSSSECRCRGAEDLGLFEWAPMWKVQLELAPKKDETPVTGPLFDENRSKSSQSLKVLTDENWARIPKPILILIVLPIQFHIRIQRPSPPTFFLLDNGDADSDERFRHEGLVALSLFSRELGFDVVTEVHRQKRLRQNGTLYVRVRASLRIVGDSNDGFSNQTKGDGDPIAGLFGVGVEEVKAEAEAEVEEEKNSSERNGGWCGIGVELEDSDAGVIKL
ncbi:hypothetical protein CPC08DRAFT_729973 [Agrocybe pediades]|nr:hypothetical protein CPC08DRAFT_729973 [Agrocybe pediades]